jgi:hypothetical protein
MEGTRQAVVDARRAGKRRRQCGVWRPWCRRHLLLTLLLLLLSAAAAAAAAAAAPAASAAVSSESRGHQAFKSQLSSSWSAVNSKCRQFSRRDVISPPGWYEFTSEMISAFEWMRFLEGFLIRDKVSWMKCLVVLSIFAISSFPLFTCSPGRFSGPENVFFHESHHRQLFYTNKIWKTTPIYYWHHLSSAILSFKI